MSDYREIIAEEQGVEQYCHCQSCGSKAELNENSEGTLWYKCTECGWFGLKYSEVVEQTKEKCEYCEFGNTFSGYGISLISKPYISVGIAKQDIGNDYFLITNEYEELSNMHGLYSNSPNRSDKVKINYCPMCGRKL